MGKRIFFSKTWFCKIVFSCFFVLLMPQALTLFAATPKSVPPSDQQNYLQEALLLEEKSDSEATTQDLKLPSLWEVALRMFLFLVIVLFMLVGFLIVFSKFFGKKYLEKNLSQDVIKVLSYRRLDLRRGIYLVDVLGKVLVVGSDAEGLGLLTEITEPEKVAEARKMSDIMPEVHRLNPFQGILEKFSGDYPEERQKGRDYETKGLLEKIYQLKTRLK